MRIRCSSCLLLPENRHYGVVRRCPECNRLWRRAWACGACDTHGVEHSLRGGGQCVDGLVWRPATWVQRLAWKRILSRAAGLDLGPQSSRLRRETATPVR